MRFLTNCWVPSIWIALGSHDQIAAGFAGAYFNLMPAPETPTPWRGLSRRLDHLPQALAGRRWLDLLAPILLLAMLAGSVLLWHGVNQSELAQHRRELNGVASSLGARVENELRGRVSTLGRMAERWVAAGGTPRAQWEVDATAYVRDMPGLISLQWLDPTGQVRWVVPLVGNERLLGTTPNRDPIRLRALQAARAQQRTMLSPPISLIQGGEGLLMFQPLQVGERFDGYLVAVTRLDALLAPLFANEPAARSVGIQYEGQWVYGRAPSAADTIVSSTALNLRDGHWTLSVTAAGTGARQSPLSALVLAAGIAGTALFAMALWFGRLALKRADENTRLAQIVARTTNGVILTDAQGRVTWVNDAFTHISGYTLHEVLGKKPGAVLQGPQTDPHVVRRMREGIARGEPVRVEILNFHKNGSGFWLNIEIQPVRGEDGTITGFMAIESDITERKHVEHALQQQYSLVAKLLETIPIPVYFKDTAGRYLGFNHAFLDFFGVQREVLLGKTLLELYEDRPEAARFHWARDQELFAQPGTQSFETSVPTAHGVRDTLYSKATFDSADGRVAGLIGVIIDMTERKKVERLKSEFVSTVSHELRTPLTSIRGALGLVMAGVTGEIGDKTREVLELAQRNGERLLVLINDILDMEKIESGKMRFELQPQALPALLRRAVEECRAYAQSFEVSVTVEEPLPEVTVQVDEVRFKQVIANLLSNAAKFSPAGGQVDVRARLTGSRVRVAVSDHGAGIPEAFRERIFRKFSQADSSDTRQRGGSGLGLAITKAIVEHMDGTIGFDSELGRGTTFYFDLPAG